MGHWDPYRDAGASHVPPRPAKPSYAALLYVLSPGCVPGGPKAEGYATPEVGTQSQESGNPASQLGKPSCRYLCPLDAGRHGRPSVAQDSDITSQGSAKQVKHWRLRRQCLQLSQSWPNRMSRPSWPNARLPAGAAKLAILSGVFPFPNASPVAPAKRQEFSAFGRKCGIE
jgi:hypothetical protein